MEFSKEDLHSWQCVQTGCLVIFAAHPIIGWTVVVFAALARTFFAVVASKCSGSNGGVTADAAAEVAVENGEVAAAAKKREKQKREAVRFRG